MLHFNPIGEVGDVVGFLASSTPEIWVPAEIEIIYFKSHLQGEYLEFYIVKVLSEETIRHSATREQLSIHKGLPALSNG